MQHCLVDVRRERQVLIGIGESRQHAEADIGDYGRQRINQLNLSPIRERARSQRRRKITASRIQSIATLEQLRCLGRWTERSDEHIAEISDQTCGLGEQLTWPREVAQFR